MDTHGETKINIFLLNSIGIIVVLFVQFSPLPSHETIGQWPEHSFILQRSDPLKMIGSILYNVLIPIRELWKTQEHPWVDWVKEALCSKVVF